MLKQDLEADPGSLWSVTKKSAPDIMPKWTALKEEMQKIYVRQNTAKMNLVSGAEPAEVHSWTERRRC